MRISDWSSDVCSSDLGLQVAAGQVQADAVAEHQRLRVGWRDHAGCGIASQCDDQFDLMMQILRARRIRHDAVGDDGVGGFEEEHRLAAFGFRCRSGRSEEHTSELQSLMRISYAVFCLKKKKQRTQSRTTKQQK